MAEAPHGTAPALQGKDIANPMAMILACGAVLHYAGVRGLRGRRARLARDLRVGARGDARPACARPTWAATPPRSGFTTEVIARVRTKIDVWSSLGTSAAERPRLRRPLQVRLQHPASVRRPA